MAAIKPFRITYTNDDLWFPQVAPQLKTTYSDTTLTFDNDIGKGSFYKVAIEPGFAVRKVVMSFRQPVVFFRKRAPRSGYYVLVANLSEQFVEFRTREVQYKLGYGSENGIYFSSPFLAASFSFAPGASYHLLFIIVTHERLLNFISRQPDTQKQLLNTIIDKRRPIYHLECLDAPLMQLLKGIDKELYDGRPNNLLIHSKALELCYNMLRRVDQRNNSALLKNIHQDDVKKLNEVRRALLDNYLQPCTPIIRAARKAAMSPTKFKTLFKQMFGHTYYQYYKNIRMHKAKELLEDKTMNVSEVAYLLGYNNLSKFTSAFKKMFSVVPSSVFQNNLP